MVIRSTDFNSPVEQPRNARESNEHLASINNTNRPPTIFVSCGLFDGRFASSHRLIKNLEKRYGPKNIVVITYRQSSLKNRPLDVCKKHFINKFQKHAQEGCNNIVLTYSMGGIIAEQAIIANNTEEGNVNILDRLSMISEVAPPHGGITNIAGSIARVFYSCIGGNGLIQELRDGEGMKNSHQLFIDVVCRNMDAETFEIKLKVNITNFTNDIVVRASSLNEHQHLNFTVNWKSDGGCFSHFFGAYFNNTYKYVLRDIEDHIHSRVSRPSDMRLGTGSIPFYYPS